MARAERGAGGRLPGAADAPSSALFKFGTEDRIQCGETSRVRGLGPWGPEARWEGTRWLRGRPAALRPALYRAAAGCVPTAAAPG